MIAPLPKSLPRVASILLLSLTAAAQGFDTLLTVDGLASHDLFGISVDGVGDIDRDGRGDFVVGAYDANSKTGSATVFSGATATVLYTFLGDDAGDRFGVSVAGAGDVNGDGYPDIVVGAYHDDNNGTDSGSVRVFSGRDGSVLYTFNGDSTLDEFGTAVAGAGDVNNDGFADIIVGAPCDDPNGTDSGRVQIFSGRDGRVLYTFDGDSAHDWHGYAVNGAGDVNNDGYDDVIVGACYDDSGTFFNNGSVRVYSGFDGQVLHTMRGTASNDWFGLSVDGVADLNRDGFDDFIVGASSADSNGVDAGAATVFSGRDGSILFYFVGKNAGDQFGVSVRGCGNFGGNKRPDIVIGAYRGSTKSPVGGSVYVMSGTDGKTLLTSEGTAADNRFGIAVGGVGDTTGDGRSEVIVGAVYADRTASNAGAARLLTITPLSMQAEPPLISVVTAGPQAISIDVGTKYAGKSYRVVGSASGTSPGIELSRKVQLDLNYDGYMQLTIDNANSTAFTGFVGTLDSAGQATATINVPANLDPSVIGLTLHHAVIVFDAKGNAKFTSNPVPLTFTL